MIGEPLCNLLERRVVSVKYCGLVCSQKFLKISQVNCTSNRVNSASVMCARPDEINALDELDAVDLLVICHTVGEDRRTTLT